MLFRDRGEAGRKLAARLMKYVDRPDVLVLALPRGGVPVGYEVARALHAPLDVFLVRKLGVPDQPELAMGAIASGGVRFLNDNVVRMLRIPADVIDAVANQERAELDRRERAIRLQYLLDELDLSGLARNMAYTLSGGEKRRLEITRALVTSPKLLLLDEPFSGIDPIAVYEVQKITRRLKERGLGILITDHNVRETLKLVDRAYLIHKGEVLYEGTAEQLVSDPKAREIYLGPDFNL